MVVVRVGDDSECSLAYGVNTQSLHQPMNAPSGTSIFPAQDMVDTVQPKGRDCPDDCENLRVGVELSQLGGYEYGKKNEPGATGTKKEVVEMLEGARITGVAGVQELYKEMMSTVFENGLESEL